VIELLVALADQVAVVGAEALVLDGVGHHHDQLVHFEGLLEVVARAQLHGRDRALHRGVGRHHHDLGTVGLGDGRGHVAHEVEPRQVRHGMQASKIRSLRSRRASRPRVVARTS
jgi:hypothetical protein